MMISAVKLVEGNAAAARARAEDGRPRAKAGRKSTWTREQGQALCALIARGRTVFDAARETGLANVAIVHRWLRNHPEFRDAYVAAAGHKRPGIAASIPVAEAEAKAKELTDRIQISVKVK